MSVAEILNYSYEDYAQWEGDWELIDGIAVSMAPAPVRKHQSLSLSLAKALDEHTEACPDCEVLYETDWKVDDETVLRPDLVLSCHDEGEAYLTKAPKLIVEVLSPSTARKDETIKFDIYEAEGVNWYLLVYPEDLRAKVYRLHDGRYRKVGDFTHETLQTDDLECNVSIDFAAVFKKLRDK